MQSKRYHTTSDGSIHEGAAADCRKCKKLKNIKKKKKSPTKKKPVGKRVCKVPGCKNTLGKINTSGYCKECFLRSPAWKNTQKSTLVRVDDD